jgi:hypothetical protein
MKKKNILGVAVAAALSIGAVTQTAQAANIAHNGVGEIAYIPYYSTQGGKQTYFRITNTSFNTLAVKIKIREGTVSRDARDFHLFLSPRDVWVGKVYSDGENIRIGTNDTSCTVPSKDRGWLKGAFGREQFTARLDDDNTVIPNDGWSVPVAHTGDTGSKEGYIVAQVMGTSEAGWPVNGGDWTPVPFVSHRGRFLENEAGTLVAVPDNCHAVSAAFDLLERGGTFVLRDQAGFDLLRDQYTEPTNALSATAAIFDPSGKLTNMPVTVIANAFNPQLTDNNTPYLESLGANDTIQVVGNDTPDEGVNVQPSIATIFDDNTATATHVVFDRAEDVVSAALMHSSLINYIDSTGTNSWIVTFPTKRNHYIDTARTSCEAPFPANCAPSISNILHSVADNGAQVSYITNEEESQFRTTINDTICFSGADIGGANQNSLLNNCNLTPNAAEVRLPREVNVVTLSPGAVANPLGSQLHVGINSDELNASNMAGWMQMRFTDSRGLVGRNGEVLNGLPAIGFSYQEYGVTNTMAQPYAYTSPFTP